MALFTGKTALVTGGGSGIGAAAAAGLAADGAKVIVVGRRLASLDAVAASNPERIRAIVCDVSDPEKVAALFANIAGKEGGVDLLLSAAGIYHRDAIAAFAMEDWHRIIATNLGGAANAIHHALPGMLERDYGRILTLGSRSAHAPGAVTSAYSASKAGVEGLSLSVAHEILWQREYRPDVHVNVLYPGQTVTGLLGEDEKEPEKYQQPADVYPFIRSVFARPRRAAMGQVIYRKRVVSRGDWKLRVKQVRANIRSLASGRKNAGAAI